MLWIHEDLIRREKKEAEAAMKAAKAKKRKNK
jgi:hypothetical protein